MWVQLSTQPLRDAVAEKMLLVVCAVKWSLRPEGDLRRSTSLCGGSGAPPLFVRHHVRSCCCCCGPLLLRCVATLQVLAGGVQLLQLQVPPASWSLHLVCNPDCLGCHSVGPEGWVQWAADKSTAPKAPPYQGTLPQLAAVDVQQRPQCTPCARATIQAGQFKGCGKCEVLVRHGQHAWLLLVAPHSSVASSA
jgi:hypothetical protein